MEIKTSGKKHEFSTGAKRDFQDGKGRYDLIPTIALERLALHYEKGAKIYGENNWRKGIPLSRFLNSAIRHILQCLDGREDEDHAAAALFNICGFIYTKHAIGCGRLPSSLSDLPEESNELDGKCGCCTKSFQESDFFNIKPKDLDP